MQRNTFKGQVLNVRNKNLPEARGLLVLSLCVAGRFRVRAWMAVYLIAGYDVAGIFGSVEASRM